MEINKITNNSVGGGCGGAMPQTELRPIMRVEGLSVDFRMKTKAFGKADVLSAVRHATFDIVGGEIFGLVGESGCGKTTLANSLLGFVTPSAGTISFDGHTLTSKSPAKDWRQARKGMQIVFQSPYTSFNPRMEVWESVTEPLYIAGERDESVLRAKAQELITRVGMGADDINRNIFEFSGGQRQRLAIARALSNDPKFVVCDEPVSSLDVSYIRRYVICC